MQELETFQEIMNEKDFNEEDLLSYIGGFVSMFLGISFLSLPKFLSVIKEIPRSCLSYKTLQPISEFVCLWSNKIRRHVKLAFGILCFSLAGLMCVIQAQRFLKDEDVSSIGFSHFSTLPSDEILTFTIC